MFLFLALLMVLLTHLLPLGVAMMVLAVAALAGLALSSHRPETASVEVRPDAEAATEPRTEPVLDADAAPIARPRTRPATVPATRNGSDGAPSGSDAGRELVGAHRS